MSKGQLTHVESRAVKNDECDNFEVILQMQIFRENLISRMKLLKQSVSLNKVYVGSSSSIQWSVSPKMSLITSLTSWIPRIMVPESHLRTGPVQSPDDALRAGSGPRSSGLHRPVVPRPTQADRWHRLQLQTVSLLVTYSKPWLKMKTLSKRTNGSSHWIHSWRAEYLVGCLQAAGYSAAHSRLSAAQWNLRHVGTRVRLPWGQHSPIGGHFQFLET